MEMVSQFCLDPKANFPVENNPIQHGDLAIAPPVPDHVEPQLPAKKPTRQWAAWTRQEEESFFTALRQVGKNFEKITRRVQSKNKDQVRHYYYRLVRRMNKLLGPGFCLDAKNSKDTNAAMLRWWSLLEKYSCKASKLHLKPRRFKIFIEALENQLIKDRKKNVRKRPSQMENSSLTASNTVTSQNRTSGNETRTVKLVLVDSQNLQRLGAGKGSIKRNVNIGVIRNNRGDSTVMKPPRQRKKQVVSASTSAYRKWEKAAIAGVSLVADAAEHLERAASNNEVVHNCGMAETNTREPTKKDPPSLPIFSQNPNIENNAHATMKLKLQLFPIDEGTRRALEMDNHNPHLELTLSTRKKISSVLEHLNRKWGSSSAATGELILFPYNAQREHLSGFQRWKQDSIVCAADVYSSMGSPPVFRLRYGWFSNDELASLTFQASSSIHSRDSIGMENERRKLVDSGPVSVQSPNDESEKQMNVCVDQLSTVNTSQVSIETAVPSTSDERMDLKQPSDVDDLRMSYGTPLSASEWADSLTNISVGDLLEEVPDDVVPDCIESPAAQTDLCLQQMAFSCDSFDAAIAAHLSKHQNKMVFQSTSSIWDAEDTCDAFSFQKNLAQPQQIPASTSEISPVTSKQTKSMISSAFIEGLHIGEEPMGYPSDENPTDNPSPDPRVVENSPQDFTGLTDIYWPESLGPLDLDMPATKYHTEEFMLTDSLSGLNRLIASSLDAFQNCSFFGLDKKEPTQPNVDARESSLLSDFKIEG